MVNPRNVKDTYQKRLQLGDSRIDKGTLLNYEISYTTASRMQLEEK